MFTTTTRLASLVCLSSLAAASLQQSLLGDGGPVRAAAELGAAAATVGLAEGSETAGGEVVENEEAPPPLSRLPSLEETRAAVLAATAGIDCSSNQRCLQTPVAAVRDYLRTLTGKLASSFHFMHACVRVWGCCYPCISARILVVTKTQLDLEDQTLKEELTKLGCLNVAVLDLHGLQATVGLFKQGVVSRMRIDKSAMERYSGRCDNKLTPLTFHQHEFGRNAVSRGQFNDSGACSPENTGGHHDPGFACGPLGGAACKELRIDPSSALKGTSMYTGEYRCTPNIYQKRPFACHAGDLSGKVGAGINVSPDSNRPDYRLLALDTHADNTCVASDNKQSLILHCESTNFRLACAPFERVETAGKRIPELLHELIRVARNALPHSKSQSSLLASLVLVHELEQRVAALETAVKAAKPGDEDDVEEEFVQLLMLLQLACSCSATTSCCCTQPAAASPAAAVDLRLHYPQVEQQEQRVLSLQQQLESRFVRSSLGCQPAASHLRRLWRKGDRLSRALT
ncbi:hypothetical protein Esti_004367 [Eimeria stiedai]